MKMIEMSFGLAKRQNVNMEYPKTWYHVWQEENVILFIILVLDIYKKEERSLSGHQKRFCSQK